MEILWPSQNIWTLQHHEFETILCQVRIVKNNQKWKLDKIYKLYSQIAVLNQKRMASWSNTIIFFQTPQQDNTQNKNIVKIMCTCAYEFNLCTTTKVINWIELNLINYFDYHHIFVVRKAQCTHLTKMNGSWKKSQYTTSRENKSKSN